MMCARRVCTSRVCRVCKRYARSDVMGDVSVSVSVSVSVPVSVPVFVSVPVSVSVRVNNASHVHVLYMRVTVCILAHSDMRGITCMSCVC